ncbi:DUF1320 domain-containing protein [Albimonas sp. CAU 1670]|jgi:phage gp36-like protein|uniref:gp436 family protein n=1 Tax=Albimonas sp. CAU 1670 TaxID=3032599 RepID=UPI0023DBB096|nr:DUF1320 domain-containing protein [Albimonas sp. CAU 1670]MDF2232176.1 DUF1320 domain-containing protein [Albimonas sp. CAU 1670]
MSYATLQQLTDRYGERMLVMLTDRGETATRQIDGDTVDRALADADALIDGYLAGRYALPLAETPPLIVDLAQRIAIWNLHTSAADEKIEADYKDARATLKDIASGAARLPVAGVEPPSSGASGVRITDRERPMTEANMKGWI